MANTLLTINMITRAAVRLWQNSNAFLGNIDCQYDDQFARVGAKIGTSLRIRLPNDYTVRTGTAAQVQDTSEQSTTLTVATQKGVDVEFSTAERAMSLDDYTKRVIAPAINNLAGAVALDVMNGSEGGISNMAPNVDGSNVLLTPTSTTFLNAGAVLNAASARQDMRKIVQDPFTEARVVGALTGLFNPASAISKQYASGKMYSALGFEWMMDQTAIKHTTGTLTSGQSTVNGAGQTGSTLVVNAVNFTLAQGDIITIAGVFGVNRITKQTTGALKQFVVTAPVAANATSIPIYPAIVPPVGGVNVQYQTVTASPANSAAVTQVLAASVTYRKNFAFVPEAVTMATADLELPKGVHEAHREQYKNISMRMVTAYDVRTDQLITRLDILYGYVWVRPEWAVIIPDIV